ncbi:MAG: EamA family transporter [Candidatus Aenigmarchaeota archaeon]|nr:EamA family transporter [Candidatus Aenigmarchaeota archaeon]
MKTGRSGFTYGLWLVAIFILLRSFYVPTFKFLTGSLHPLAIDTYIFLVSSIVLIFLLRGKLKNFLALEKKERKYFYMLIIPAAVGNLLLDFSILYLPVKAFVIFISAMPIIVGFYSSRLLKETPSKILWVAALLAVIGAIVFKSGSITGLGWGDLFIILGVFLFSFTPIVNRKYIKKLGTREIMFLDSVFILVPTIIAALALGVLAIPPLNTY